MRRILFFTNPPKGFATYSKPLLSMFSTATDTDAVDLPTAKYHDTKAIEMARWVYSVGKKNSLESVNQA